MTATLASETGAESPAIAMTRQTRQYAKQREQPQHWKEARDVYLWLSLTAVMFLGANSPLWPGRGLNSLRHIQVCRDLPVR